MVAHTNYAYCWLILVRWTTLKPQLEIRGGMSITGEKLADKSGLDSN